MCLEKAYIQEQSMIKSGEVAGVDEGKVGAGM